MTVVLNEAALERLLQSEAGPVGQDLSRRAQNVTAQAEVNASGAIIGIQTGDLHSGVRFEVGQGDDGLQAVVRTDAQHRGFNYPAWHDQNGRPWLTDALRDAFDL